MTDQRQAAPAEAMDIRVTTDRRTYAPGDSISLKASYQNLGAEPFALNVNGTNLLRASDQPMAPQMATAPLYSMERLVLTVNLDAGPTGRVELTPVWSTMFFIHRLLILQPGERYDEAALLTTPFWEPADSAESPLHPAGPRDPDHHLLPPAFPPGRYSLQAIYTAPPLKPTDVEKMRRFTPAEDLETSVDAFFRLGIMGISYNQMEIYRTCDFRAWSGRIQTEAFEFTVK